MHLYDQQGKPVYKVPYADKSKGMRDSTLRDARKYGYVPSVTEVLRVMAAPGLEIWKQNQILDAALETEQFELNGDDVDSAIWKTKVKKKAGEISKTAAEEGTNIHDAIESKFKGRVINRKYRNLADKVYDYVIREIGNYDWSAESSFADPIGFGGKIDLSSTKEKIVLDFKSKQEIILGKKMAYDNHVMQTAAYSHGLFGTISNIRQFNLFVSWDGDIVLHEWKQEEIERGWDMFMACFNLFCLSKKFNPSF